jgi:hypothetical protein
MLDSVPQNVPLKQADRMQGDTAKRGISPLETPSEAFLLHAGFY